MPTIPYVGNTWTDGVSSASAARITTMESGILAAHYMPAVCVTHNAAQSITNNTVTALAFNTERFDQASNAADTMHDTVTNNSRLTCRYAGVYQISGSIEFAGNSTGDRAISIRIGGVDTIVVNHIAVPATGIGRVAISRLWAMAVNDYAELMAFQTSGGALNVNATAKYSPEFMMVRVG